MKNKSGVVAMSGKVSAVRPWKRSALEITAGSAVYLVRSCDY
jgi:hypothetical protein